MPWLSARSADKLVASRCAKLEKGEVIRVESFKGDRWIEVRRVAENNYSLLENGFNRASYNVTSTDLKPLIRRLFDVEFPRSHQVRLTIASEH